MTVLSAALTVALEQKEECYVGDHVDTTAALNIDDVASRAHEVGLELLVNVCAYERSESVRGFVVVGTELEPVWYLLSLQLDDTTAQATLARMSSALVHESNAYVL